MSNEQGRSILEIGSADLRVATTQIDQAIRALTNADDRVRGAGDFVSESERITLLREIRWCQQSLRDVRVALDTSVDVIDGLTSIPRKDTP